MANQIRTLTAREIECRVAQISKSGKGLSLLLYKNARCDMDILDETFGCMNWQRRHCRENANCIVSIWDADKREWIEKEDTGTESNTEAEKGLASDSFKRACVNIGIGRELYTAPFIWITSANAEITLNDKGKYECRDRFEVAEIGYNEHREINRLRIVNAKTKNTVFDFGEKAPETAKPAEEPSEKSDEVKTAIECERCGKVITGAVLDDGTKLAAHEIIGQSKIKYNAVYCLECQAALGDKAPEKPQVKMASDAQKKYIIDHATDEDYMKIMQKYGAYLENLTSAMASRVIKKIDENNKVAS